MNNPKILVVGATGKTGGAVARQLLEKGYPVKAMVRARDFRSDELEKLGAELAFGEVFDYDQVLAAMQGVSRAYYFLAFHPQVNDATTIFAIAARKARLESVVSLGQWLSSPRNPSLLTRQQWMLEQLFSSLPDIMHTSVNPGYFADNYLNTLIYAASNLGVYPWPYGESKNAPPSNEDIARVAVSALIDPEKHNGKAYRPTGPELLGGQDITNKIAGVLNRRVQKLDLPPVIFLRALRAINYPIYQQLSVSSYIEDHRQGAFAFCAPTDHVLTVGGQAAEPFEKTAQRYLQDSRATKNFSNGVREAVNFMKIAITPSMNFEKYKRDQFHPLTAKPLLAMEDSEWKKSHGEIFLHNAKSQS